MISMKQYTAQTYATKPNICTFIYGLTDKINRVPALDLSTSPDYSQGVVASSMGPLFYARGASMFTARIIAKPHEVGGGGRCGVLSQG